MESYETLKVEARDGYLEVALDRPDVLNALNQQMAEELCDVMDWASGQTDIRATLLRGEGRAFSAGGDLKVMREGLDDNPAEFFETPLARIHEAALSLARLPHPTVAAVHGFASGAAFNLALCCDLRLCSSDARFQQAFSRIGAAPDTGGSFLLPRLVGSARALELLYLGEFLDAARSEELGIVNRVVPPDKLLDEARALVARLAEGPTRAYAEIKHLVTGSRSLTLAEALDEEQRAQLRVAGTADFKEGVSAFFDKRPPRFRGR